MRWIYISPHLDDAVFSAGGLVYDQIRAGMAVEIWTLFCGYPSDPGLSPYAQKFHRNWGFADASEAVRFRRAEDVQAVKVLGAQFVHFDFLDSIYRRGKNGSWLYSYASPFSKVKLSVVYKSIGLLNKLIHFLWKPNIGENKKKCASGLQQLLKRFSAYLSDYASRKSPSFVPPHDDEAGLPAQIAEVLAARLQPDTNLVCPLGLGAHVDHILARRAVEALKRPIWYYAEVPYLFHAPQELSAQIIGMEEHTCQITEAGLTAWQHSALAYASQADRIFESPEDMRKKIQNYWEQCCGIRLWLLE